MADPITRSGSYYSTPRDSNRVPLLVGASTADGITPVTVEVNPTTGGLIVTFTPTTLSTASNPASAVSVTGTSGTLVASNSSRKYLLIRNVGTDIVYFRLASSTATTSDMALYPGDSWEMSQLTVYTGQINAIAASGTQSVRIVEY